MLYAVKNDKGEYAHIDMDDLTWETGFATLWFGINEPYAKRTADDYGGHVVELAEAPAKVVVSEEEAKMLKKAKDTTVWRPAAVISKYAYNSEKDNGQEALLEDRLMRAYVNGYTVEKEKKYLLPMDGTLEEGDDNDNFQLYAYCYKGRWLVDEVETDPSYKHQTVTQKELETAPAWAKAIKPLEVTDDDE